MKSLNRLGLVGAIAVMGNAAQAKESFCAEVREVVAAARESPPFSSLPRDSRRIGQLGFYLCQTDSLDGNPRFLCHGYPTGPHSWSGNQDEMVSWIEQCLPQAVRSEEVVDSGGRRLGPDDAPGRRLQRHEFRNVHLDLAALRFTITLEVHTRYRNVVLTAYNRSREGELATPD